MLARHGSSHEKVRGPIQTVKAGGLASALGDSYYHSPHGKGSRADHRARLPQGCDYDAWKRSFDEVVATPLHGAVRSTRVWRSLDDPNLVVLYETYDSRAAAEATFTNPAALAAMEEAGVDVSTLRVEYLDEVAMP